MCLNFHYDKAQLKANSNLPLTLFYKLQNGLEN